MTEATARPTTVAPTGADLGPQGCGAHPLHLPGIVLVNDRARASSLPTLGGVWSLVDLTRGRELPERLDFWMSRDDPVEAS